MKKVFLIRHAESLANAWHPTVDPATVAITDKWKNQARLLAESRNIDLDVIIYSLYTRTYQTARPMMEKFTDAAVVQSPYIHEFTYLDPVQCANTTFVQRKIARDRFWSDDDLFYQDWPGAESVDQLMTRVRLFVAYLHALPDQCIAVFSHGQYIRVLMDVVSHPNKEYTKNEIYRLLYETDDIHNCGVIELY